MLRGESLNEQDNLNNAAFVPFTNGIVYNSANEPVNGAGVPLSKLHSSPGRPYGKPRNLHAKWPSSISKAFKKQGLDWQADFAQAILHNKRERIKLWLKLLPYLVTTVNRVKVKRWKGKASRAALVALEALEGKPGKQE
jgi:hypothetical protein